MSQQGPRLIDGRGRNMSKCIFDISNPQMHPIHMRVKIVAMFVSSHFSQCLSKFCNAFRN